MVGRRRRDAIYWDTCIWIAWFSEEVRPQPSDMEGVQEDVERFERGEVFIATSPIILPEILNIQGKMTLAQRDRFQRFFNRSDVIKVAADIGVCRLAQEIRDYYYGQRQLDSLPAPDIGDALHLASAIQYQCLALHTFDENDRRTPSKAQRGLIGMSGNVAGKYALTIRKPQVTQQQLQLVQPRMTLYEGGPALPVDKQRT